MADELFAVVASGEVKIRIDQRYPLADAAQAHRDSGGAQDDGLERADSVVAAADAAAIDGWTSARPRPGVRSLERSARAPHAQQLVQDQQHRADRDRAVGEVERREVAAVPVDLDEVDDVAVHHAVDHVADRAAEDHRERPAEELLRRRGAAASRR